jgi:acyl transferase domain-containing protein
MREPRLRYFSNLTGTWVDGAKAKDPDYWASQLRNTVRFWDALREVSAGNGTLLVEVGPGRSLATIARQAGCDAEVFGSLRHPREKDTDEAVMKKSAGKLWVVRSSENPLPVYTEEKRYRISLPTYPFERQRYWIDAVAQPQMPMAPAGKVAVSPPSEMVAAAPEEEVSSFNDAEQEVIKVWQSVLGVSELEPETNFFDLGGDSLQATQILARCRRDFNVSLPARVFFENPTVSGLTAAIAMEHLDTTNQAELEEALAEIRNLSPEELQAELLSERSTVQDTERLP